MQYARIYKITVFCLIFILSLSSYAHAAAIINLDSKSHVFEVNGQEITLDTEKTWTIPGQAEITYGDKKYHMDETDEYAIWNDHDFALQQRIAPGTGSFNR